MTKKINSLCGSPILCPSGKNQELRGDIRDITGVLGGSFLEEEPCRPHAKASRHTKTACRRDIVVNLRQWQKKKVTKHWSINITFISI